MRFVPTCETRKIQNTEVLERVIGKGVEVVLKRVAERKGRENIHQFRVVQREAEKAPPQHICVETERLPTQCLTGQQALNIIYIVLSLAQTRLLSPPISLPITPSPKKKKKKNIQPLNFPPTKPSKSVNFFPKPIADFSYRSFPNRCRTNERARVIKGTNREVKKILKNRYCRSAKKSAKNRNKYRVQ